MRDGALTARALVERCLERIAAVDGAVQAWISVDTERARAEADACDTEAGQGRLRGPLHGVPFAIKDVIDFAGWPTRAGSRSRDDAPPSRIDAIVVARLRAQGAIPLGKVHTTEFAFKGHRRKSRFHPRRSGSSRRSPNCASSTTISGRQ